MSAEAPVYPLNEDSYWAAYSIWDHLRVESPAKEVKTTDTIIVFGCANKQVGVKAGHLYQELGEIGRRPLVVCTGGNSKKTAGWDITEAELNLQTLLTMGVLQGQIKTETRAKNFGKILNTPRNFCIKLAENRMLLTGVPIDFAARRCVASMFRKWKNVATLVVPAGLVFEDYRQTPERFSNLALNLVTELYKVINYPAEGWMEGQDMNAQNYLRAVEAESVLQRMKTMVPITTRPV